VATKVTFELITIWNGFQAVRNNEYPVHREKGENVMEFGIFYRADTLEFINGWRNQLGVLSTNRLQCMYKCL